MDIIELLKEVIERGASDLHLTVGKPPTFRIDGRLIFSDHPPLSSQDTEEMARSLLDSKRWQKFVEENELDFSTGIPQVGRFRVNVYRQRGSCGLAIRALSYHIPSMEELGLPVSVLQKLASLPRGLILVTGPTGSGKSTTLASMIDYINSTRSCHIVTIEDPIEYLHAHKKSLVNQREVGSDTPSFESALVHALRQDPDVILVGEMRNLETVNIALQAAETGHLVMATLHTNNAPQSVDRIIDIFPPHQQLQVRVQLASCIQGIISQQLLPRADGKGRVPACEVMIANNAIRNLIREGKSYQIYSVMQTNRAQGMITMDQALFELYQKGLITWESALERAVDPKELLLWKGGK
ncbi:type IV pilus twitching motility protein PilT [Thermatribacter velox]|uniref:Type IV pilus twitching motility protein PilT n=1 Tax=Thermatribacter velox TaxID=3039681 RepID=A0ABZ2YCD9_9BACT